MQLAGTSKLHWQRLVYSHIVTILAAFPRIP